MAKLWQEYIDFSIPCVEWDPVKLRFEYHKKQNHLIEILYGELVDAIKRSYPKRTHRECLPTVAILPDEVEIFKSFMDDWFVTSSYKVIVWYWPNWQATLWEDWVIRLSHSRLVHPNEKALFSPRLANNLKTKLTTVLN